MRISKCSNMCFIIITSKNKMNLYMNWYYKNISSFLPLILLLILFQHLDERDLTLDLINSSIYTYFLDNQQTSSHQSVIFGLRELNSTEINDFCLNQSINNPPITNQAFNFTAEYELRTYTSCCYYLDTNNIWQTDGLLVSFHLFSRHFSHLVSV